MERRPPKPDSPESESQDEKDEDVMQEQPTPPSQVDGEETEKEAPLLPDGDAPPLPDEPPPLPTEVPPAQPVDDGWEPMWDDRAQAFYFYNRLTQVSQWENPRVPDSIHPGPPGVANNDRDVASDRTAVGGYNPAVHGDYDPNADYAKVKDQALPVNGAPSVPGQDSSDAYAATGAFNRFTGKWQNADFTPDRFSDESKSKRQMNAFFDVDAAANSHDGKSLRAERQQKKLSKQELKAFKEKRREKKEEKRRAWLKD